MEPAPRAVVFDLGKVLLDFDYDRALARFAARGTRPFAELRRRIVEAPIMMEYERGECTSEEFFERVRRETGIDGDFAAFAGEFGDIFTPIAGMIEMQAELRARGVPTFIFSNTNDLAIRHIRQRYPFFAGFDGYVLSYEHGAMKPDAPLYEVVERMTGLAGGSLVYLDDRPENIETGLARGWRAIQHQDPTESRRRVASTGLLG